MISYTPTKFGRHMHHGSVDTMVLDLARTRDQRSK